MAKKGKQGDRVVWCASCAAWFKAPGGYKPFCPVCGSPIRRFKCTRCGHEWKPNNPAHIPKTCPECSNPYAFYTRVRAVPEDPPKACPLPDKGEKEEERWTSTGSESRHTRAGPS